MKMSHMDKVFVLKKLPIGIGRSLTAPSFLDGVVGIGTQIHHYLV